MEEEKKYDNWVEEMIDRECLPQTLRKKTVEKLCEEWGVSVATYYYQVSKKENQKKILEKALNIAKKEVPEVLQALIENAKKGKEKSIELYLNYVIKLAKNLDLKTDGQALTKVLDDKEFSKLMEVYEANKTNPKAKGTNVNESME